MGHARFSALVPGVLRMEYSPSGSYENRRSVRAMCRPDPLPFSGGLDTGRMRAEYTNDGRPFAAGNLRIVDSQTGALIWDPSVVDEQNLGGVHVSMDCVKPGLIPSGVHPATAEHHHIGIDQTLWSFFHRLNSESSGDLVGDAATQAVLFDEILATRDLDRMPAALRELMQERWKFPPGLLSRSGFYLYNDSSTPLMDPEKDWVDPRPREAGSQDLYLFYYQQDYAQALRDYRLIFGQTPLIPRYALGLWYSRYPTFSGRNIHELVGSFAEHDLPLDVFVFDLEWHLRGWNGFDWDTEHMGDPDALLAFLKREKIHTTFNVHPNSVPIEDSRFESFLDAAGLECDRSAVQPDYRGVKTFCGFNVADRRQADAFMEVLHKPVQDQGVDFWWIDGDCKVQGIEGLDSQLWTNHMYHEHIKTTYADRRPMIFSREPGLGAHRYPFHFTADTWSYWETLQSQVEQTLRAGHIGQSYITHDIGGHISSALHIDPELYMRWVQFATLSPVVRLHSSKQGEGIGGERRPWAYGPRVLDSFRTAMRFRMSLIPYLYTLAWVSHETGMPMCRSNPLQLPHWTAGYTQWDAYFLGDRIYAAPVLNPGTLRKVILPPGKWVHGITGHQIASDGETVRTEISPFADVPLHYVRAGSLLIRQPYSRRASVLPETLMVEIYPAAGDWEDSFTLYEDDGMSQEHLDGRSSRQTFRVRQSECGLTLTVEAREGGFDGMPAGRKLHIRLMNPAATDPVEIDLFPDVTTEFPLSVLRS
jgi:alpha-glucosidase (family GH31 glycosyl hydrolase)